MPGIYVHSNGTFNSVNEVYVNQAGTWLQAKEVYVKQSGVWSRVYPDSGFAEYTTPGTYSFVVPGGVTTVSCVLIGAGGKGERNGGASGAVVRSRLPVTPGETLSLLVGNVKTGEDYSPGESTTVTGLSGEVIALGGNYDNGTDYLISSTPNGMFGWPYEADGRGGNNFYIPGHGFYENNCSDRPLWPSVRNFYSGLLAKYGVWPNANLYTNPAITEHVSFNLHVPSDGTYKLNYSSDGTMNIKFNDIVILSLIHI